jgi:hypothetical protein
LTASFYELRDPDVGRSETTIDNYLTLFKAHIIPRWGATFLKRAAQEHVGGLFLLKKAS